MNGNLYVITNIINQKHYIGKTYKDIEKRFKEHIQESKKDRCKNRPL
jgi:predicted GIY-YIG superfamily endonuclease